MKFLDLVVSGCDFSGTTTQINGLVRYFQSVGESVKDIRGTETDAMFHAESLEDCNRNWISFDKFCHGAHPFLVSDGINQVHKLVRKNKYNISSMVRNDVSEYINPDSADVWIMEEPTNRGAGQTVRTVELFRSKFGSESNQESATYAHQAYRSEEFLRFRKALRESGKTILRSRSEESACYQIFDDEHLKGGVSRDFYLSLPGHKIAFGNPPTHIFIVCGPENWTKEEYLELKRQRTDSRVDDDYEKDADYQVMVNHRYATSWLEELYEQGCGMHGGKVPNITRFNIYDDIPTIDKKMAERIVEIQKELSE